MIWLIEIDVAWETPIQSILDMIRKHKGAIKDFDPRGPGGGNPNLLLSFLEYDDARAFALEYFPDDPPEARGKVEMGHHFCGKFYPESAGR